MSPYALALATLDFEWVARVAVVAVPALVLLRCALRVRADARLRYRSEPAEAEPSSDADIALARDPDGEMSRIPGQYEYVDQERS
jgi:hypothetical protein